MNKLSQCYKAAATLLLIFAALGKAVQAQDRNQNIDMEFPADCFVQNGGRLIDITQHPYNARGNGNPADAAHNTAAFIAAYDFLMSELDSVWTTGHNPSDPDEIRASYVIYIPEGTYHVNDTLIYSGAMRPAPLGAGEKLIWVRFWGEKRNSTIIKLVDNAPGFNDPATPKAVVSFGKSEFNNKNAKNDIRNLTVDIGKGNYGAIGIKMAGANSASASYLTVRTPAGSNYRKGHIGLDFSIGTAVGYYHDITIDGFTYGIQIGAPKFTHPVLEHITVKHAKQAGIYFGENASATLRKVSIRRGLNAIRLDHESAHAVILDSRFYGGKANRTALQINDGVAFVRNCTISNFGFSVKKGSSAEATGNIAEYVSEPVMKYRNSNSISNTSMGLFIDDVPYPAWENNLNNWVTAGVGDGIIDDGPALQAAIDANLNATVLYLPKKKYRINTTVDLPARITRIVCMYGEILGKAKPKFNVAENSETALLIQDLQTLGSSYHLPGVRQSGSRTVILDNASGYQNVDNDPNKKVFLNNSGIAYKERVFKNQIAYMRYSNVENKAIAWEVDNASLVVLGYKTEGGGNSFKITNGSEVEILGGLSNQESSGWEGINTSIIVEDSDVSFSMATSGGNLSRENKFENIVQNSESGSPTYTVKRTDTTSRNEEAGHILSLYNNQ